VRGLIYKKGGSTIIVDMTCRAKTGKEQAVP
jgi:hypothetical protein